MRFLADEGCDYGIVRALRAVGYDVQAISEMSPRAEDTEVIALAAREERIVLTEDGDFGQLVYAHGQQTHGVVFIRYPITMRKRLGHDVVTLVKQRGDTLIGCFVVLQPGRIRISRVPGE